MARHEELQAACELRPPAKRVASLLAVISEKSNADAAKLELGWLEHQDLLDWFWIFCNRKCLVVKKECRVPTACQEHKIVNAWFEKSWLQSWFALGDVVKSNPTSCFLG
jgi:hypothetical protein